MKIPIYTSVLSVFIEVQNRFSSENDWTSLNFIRQIKFPPKLLFFAIRQISVFVNYLLPYHTADWEWGRMTISKEMRLTL